MKKRAIIYKEHTLGLYDAREDTIEVLRSLISKGAPFRLDDDPIYLTRADELHIRTATLKDFEEYRVQYNKSYIIV